MQRGYQGYATYPHRDDQDAEHDEGSGRTAGANPRPDEFTRAAR